MNTQTQHTQFQTRGIELRSFSVEDLIPDEENALVLTSGGYIKRTNPDEFRRQKRGGVGVVDLDTKDEDFVTTLLITSTHSDLLFFTNRLTSTSSSSTRLRPLEHLATSLRHNVPSIGHTEYFMRR